jgi:hypothetical protein
MRADQNQGEKYYMKYEQQKLNETVKESKGIKEKKIVAKRTQNGGSWKNCPQSAGPARTKTERKGNKRNQRPKQPSQGHRSRSRLLYSFLFHVFFMKSPVQNQPEAFFTAVYGSHNFLGSYVTKGTNAIHR